MLHIFDVPEEFSETEGLPTYNFFEIEGRDCNQPERQQSRPQSPNGILPLWHKGI
jgi:hypothetical protein